MHNSYDDWNTVRKIRTPSVKSVFLIPENYFPNLDFVSLFINYNISKEVLQEFYKDNLLAS